MQQHHPHIALIRLLPRELTSLSLVTPGFFARRKAEREYAQVCFS